MRLRGLLLSVLAGTALAVPASPAAAAACGQGAGVTVVVDFASLGGGVSERCASGDPSTGIAALRAAGFSATRAAQEPGYFVCRINGKPANDPCQRTSPADAYWSYWHAKPGGSWTYASTGANDYNPAPGTVDGWAFGAGKPPSRRPPSTPSDPSAPPTQAAVASPAGAPSAAAVARPTAAPRRTEPAVAPTGPQTSLPQSAPAAVRAAPTPT
ncbi:MAG: hypothetical protein QOE05_2719, partial [Actinomycetota bacterium]|nr:hypothetical protein [Actinomycetota bacterium]